MSILPARFRSTFTAGPICFGLVMQFPLFATAARAPRLEVPPFPANLDLSAVERLYKSEAYRVEVRAAGAGDFVPCTVFETRNDWVFRDFFTKTGDKARVIKDAHEFGSGKGSIRTASFAQFSFADTAVEVRVTLLAPDAVTRSVTIRPLRHEIPTVIAPDGKTVTFRLARPLKLSVEINDRLNPLFLFTDAPDVPDRAATYYFGPGVHRLPGELGRLTLKSGEHLYIAAGAIVEGRIAVARGSSNVRIAGRGILSCGEWPHTSVQTDFLVPHTTLTAQDANHLLLEGLTMVQGSGWTVAIGGDRTHDNVYRNIKMVHWAGNTDAFWITGDRNRLEDSFVFCNDDAIVTKGGRDSVVSNFVFWGGVWGRLLLFHNFGRPIENLTIENVDVIGKEGTPQLILGECLRTSPVIDVRNVVLRNLRVEERKQEGNYNRNRLIWIDAEKARIRLSGLHFENVTLDRQFEDEGYLLGSEKIPHRDITFQNLRMGGRPILSAADSHITFNEWVSGVKFTAARSDDTTP